jgi:hypothetical protein
MKQITIRLVALFVCVLLGTILTWNIEKKAKEETLRLKFCGIIDSIEVKSGNRGIAIFKINDKWIPSNDYTIDIAQIFRVNDSVCKKENSEVVEIFRKNDRNIYVKIYPNN